MTSKISKFKDQQIKSINESWLKFRMQMITALPLNIASLE